MVEKRNIYWFLRGNQTLPSSRIHGINIHKEFVKQGYSSHILYCPLSQSQDLTLSDKTLNYLLEQVTPYDIFIFQKLEGSKLDTFIHLLKSKNISTVYIDSDYPLKKTALACKLIICPSSFLSSLYKEVHSNVKYIPDAIEDLQISSPPHNNKAIWFGRYTKERDVFIRQFIDHLKKDLPNWEFDIFTNSLEEKNTWNNFLKYSFDQYRVVILPIETLDSASMCKSSNRALLGMQSGKIVLASPIDSYTDLIQNNETGFICRSTADWINTLKKIEQNNFNKELVLNAKKVASSYHIEKVLMVWKETLNITPSTSDEKKKKKMRRRIILDLLQKTPSKRKKTKYISLYFYSFLK